MSFFDSLGLDKQVVNDESANQVMGFRKINGGTNAVAYIKSIAWKEANAFTNEHIVAKFCLTNTSFEGCYADLKIHLKDPDGKKRQQSANLFSRLYLLCGIAPPDNLPTDADLAAFSKKLLGIEIFYYCMQSEDDGKWRDGNLVNALFSAEGFLPVEGGVQVQDLNQLNLPAQGGPLPSNEAPKPMSQQAAPTPAMGQATQAPAATQQPVTQQPTAATWGG